MPSPRIMMYFICNSFIVFSKASTPPAPHIVLASVSPCAKNSHPAAKARPPSLFPAVGIEKSSGGNHAARSRNLPDIGDADDVGEHAGGSHARPGSVALDLHRVLLVPLGRQQNHVVAAGQVIEGTLAIHLARNASATRRLPASGGAARNRRPPRESGARTPRPTPRNTSRE